MPLLGRLPTFAFLRVSSKRVTCIERETPLFDNFWWLFINFVFFFFKKKSFFFNISWVSTWETYLSETHEKGVPANTKILIWYEFSTPRGTVWLKKGKEVRKRVAKTLGFHIQNGHRSAFCWSQITFLGFWRPSWGPQSIQKGSCYRIASQAQPRQRPSFIFWAISGPKTVQKSLKNKGKTEPETSFEFDAIFGSIFVRFWRQNKINF